MYVCVHEHTGTYIHFKVWGLETWRRGLRALAPLRGDAGLVLFVCLPASMEDIRQVPSLKLVAQRRDLVISAALTLCAAQPDMIENL